MAVATVPDRRFEFESSTILPRLSWRRFPRCQSSPLYCHRSFTNRRLSRLLPIRRRSRPPTNPASPLNRPPRRCLPKQHQPLRPDTIFRIYSQTKAIVSVAIMMLYEEGRFQLDDPIARFVPAFRDMRVYKSGSRGKLETEPARRGITSVTC